MLSSSLLGLPSALVAYVAAVFAVPAVPTAPSLTVKTSTFNPNVDGLENLKVTATVVNTGSETLKLFNDPRGVLDPFPEDSFTITNPSGSNPSFNGPRADYNTTDATGLDDSSVFTVLAPGDSVNVTHDLSAAYDFTRSSAGDYSIEPWNLFTYVDADGTPKDLYATVVGIAKVKLFGDLAVPRHVHSKRAFIGCSDHQQGILNAAIVAATAHLAEALAYLESHTTPTPRYVAWLGPYDEARKAAVQDTFRKMINNTPFTSLTYDCACIRKKRETYVAFVSHKPENAGKVFICPLFWKRPPTGANSQYGTLIHEASHYKINGHSRDRCYQHLNCHYMARMNPELAIKNANNLRFFVENKPALR